MVAHAQHERLGEIGLIRSPINLSNHAPEREFGRAAPELGAHNQEIYAELGLSDQEIQALRRAGAI